MTIDLTDEDSITIIKKDETRENFNPSKIVNAVNKSATRVSVKLQEDELKNICNLVYEKIKSSNREIHIKDVHNIVEGALEQINPLVAKSYRDYRNYKQDFVAMLDKVYKESQRIMYVGDKENANADSTLVSTKRSLIFNELNKELYKKFFLTVEELQAIRDGYIYIHDMAARRDTLNCCLFDVATVLKDGFEMGNIWYNEPKTLDVAFDVIGDIVMAAASQQYGGFTIPEVDRILLPYAEKSYLTYLEKYNRICRTPEIAQAQALEDVQRDFEQGFQGWEYKFNTVASSRGDYPFINVTFGLGTNQFEKMATKAILKTRKNGQGKKECKKPVLFPKLVFLYDENLHGSGCINEDLFEAGVECSRKTMYPDWLSMTGEGYIASMYKKYGRVISPMGCRAFLSPWYEKGGISPADENDKPIFVGRFNIGAISLHLPLIYAKAKRESKDFYVVLDYYLELIRQLHLRTYAYLGELKASVNPLAFCEGGFLGGHLKHYEKIEPLLKPATASFGITALNELQQLHNGKSIAEDGAFALEVMQYINKKIVEFKEADGRLYAIYGTPAENLCFSGDTLVSTYSGYKKIKDVTTDDLVYSYNDSTKKIELNKVLASKMTQEHAVVVKVTTDNGQEFICTPDHPFAVRTLDRNSLGQFIQERVEYIAAKDLQEGMRLKSGYLHQTPIGRYHFNQGHDNYRHIINACYKYGLKEIPEGYNIHHIDQDVTNDSFDNLELLTVEAHRKEHLKDTIEPYQFTSESVKGELNPFFGMKHTKESKLANRKAHLGDSVERFSLEGKHLESFECLKDVTRKYGYTKHAIRLCCQGKYSHNSTNGHQSHNSLWYYTKDCKEVLEANHKVVSVEFLDELMPVYNIEVENNHNFYIGGDQAILVHNCGLQIKQFREKFGIVKDVSDKPYISNSFHCHVTEKINPIEKQDLEGRFWELLNGGKIQYVRYPVNYNAKAVATLIRRAMKKGFYEGVNLSLSYCDDCGHQELDMDVCPVCGSKNLTKIDRMNGYLAYSRVKGDSRLADHKMEEIKDRISM